MEFNSLSKPKSEFQDGELLQEKKQQEQEEKGETILVSSLTIKTRSLGEFKVAEDDNDGGGFRTPTSLDQRIPVITQCPPAPRKPKKTLSLTTKRKAASRRLMLDLSTEIDSFLADLDGSFFHEKSITLGSLLGVSSIVDLSRTRTRTRTRNRTTSIMRRRPQVSEANNNKKKTYRFKPNWCISLCPRDTTDAETVNNNNNTPSLGHFLAVERMAANEHRRSHNSPLIYGPEDEVAVLAQLDGEQNSLFVNGSIAPPPHSSPWFGSDEHGNGYGGGVPVLFSCMCGQAIH
ncbi:hypothetical protein HYC85_007047 [Camellia sinensis]|uniref:Uncharacterized protein n=1 Tax=Camellia sinensis TaxID=4442 RepID=A0A7J7HPS8_CAMSI|nr:hypothetical protein HYC85_007047 [Camellia sinensis]